MAFSTKGIIAAGHLETARAGAYILEAGGNAFDAAVAAVFASFVSEPSLTSLGGGGFMTAVEQSGNATLFDFFVQTPGKRRPLDQIHFIPSQINFGSEVQKQFIGKGSVAVPGCPAGLYHVHQRLGKLPFREILAPAIELARKGVTITPYQSYSISILEPVLLHSEASARVFAPEGHLIREGETMYRPLLADTLEQFEREGIEVFYKGEIARKFSEDNLANGGSVFIEDLERYHVIERKPFACRYRGKTVLTNPPPSEGGSMICYGLALLNGIETGAYPPHGNGYVRTLAEVMKHMDLFRKENLPVSADEIDVIISRLSDSAVEPVRKKADYLGSTSHVSVMDEYGNAAAVTSTLGGASGEVIPGTGIPSNNMLGELDLNPDGFYNWPVNTRMTSMMSPTIVMDQGKPVIVTGSGGSSRIRTAILQVLLNLIDHGMPPEKAVDYPRLHWEYGKLSIEPGLLEDAESFDMPDTRISAWEEKNMFFGGVHTLTNFSGAGLSGAPDRRRDGFMIQVD